MDKVYNPQEIEKNWYETWEQNNYFVPSGNGPAYSIMLPPPNVTGSLHMGHGFQCTVMDILIRYHRMKGYNTLWQAGTDHAGIATQMVVERQLLQEGKSRHDLGRDAFVEKIWEWKNYSGDTIVSQFKRLGASMDWHRQRFTMDKHISSAVQEVFIRLYNEGLIYRGKRLVNWDPKLHTAISDLEVISSEEEGKLWHIRYPLVDSKEYLTVATTRPETMLGDVAVAVNPNDARYKHLIGKHLTLPLTDRTIPIIGDEYVEQEFGTGCVKITPAHDFNDYTIGERHQLPIINILTKDAHLNDNVPETYQGLERFAAREKVLKDLEALGLLDKTEKHLLKVPRGDRSGVILEPYITEQWYMKMKSLADVAIEAVKSGEVSFIPENWDKTYYQWLNNIEDWCISRQLWWGHRIPAWYDDKQNIYVGHSEADVREKYHLHADTKLQQDDDVLDTWVSASLWPFATLGWPDESKDFKDFYPTQVLVTGFDIIFFWVARMIMMGLKFTGHVPFKHVFITGLIRDADGQKMSKSKGNVIDPLDLIDGISLEALIAKRTHGLMQPAMGEKIKKSTTKQFPNGIAPHGTDAVRFTFCALASHNREIRYDMHRLEGYRNFCNKLWNASRYVLMSTENFDCGLRNKNKIFSLADLWILSKLQETIQQVEDNIAQYRFDLVAASLYEFTWNEFCDWYLELTKVVLFNADAGDNAHQGTRYTLITVLETLLRLLHPVIPFITEEIWQRVAPLAGQCEKSIMHSAYPEKNAKYHSIEVNSQIDFIKNVIVSIRTIRSEMNINPSKIIPTLLCKGSDEQKQIFAAQEKLITTMAKIHHVQWLSMTDTIPESATALVNDLEIFIPLADLIDKKEEAHRLNREILKIREEIHKIDSKLRTNFVDKAPAIVVQKERDRLIELNSNLEKLKAQFEKIGV